MIVNKKSIWFDKPSVFLLSLVIVLLIFILAVVLFIGTSVSDSLEQSVIDGLYSQQKSLADEIDLGMVRNFSAVVNLMNPENFENPAYRDLFFHESRKAFTGLRAISVTVEDRATGKSEVFSDMGFLPKPIDENVLAIDFEEDAITSIGLPYQDSLGLFTLQPVYISFYTYDKTYILAFEFNISEIFFNSIQTKVFPASYYSVSLFSADGVLLETSKNYPRKSYMTLSNAENLNLTHSEQLQLNSEGLVIKDSDCTFVMTPSECGYVICGNLGSAYIQDVVRPIVVVVLVAGFVGLAAILLLAMLFVRYRKLEENQIQMQIDTIRTKLDPHFLFNSLNSMVGLISTGKDEKLIDGIRNLSQMIRSTLELGTYISLFDELEFIRSYIEVQYLRYGDIFEYKCNVLDESLLYEEIPKFTIQPIIENCFVHAVALVKEENRKVHIYLSVQKSGRDLLINIENDGPVNEYELSQMIERLGNNKNTGRQKIGLSLINRELKLLYGRKYGLSIQRTDSSLVVSIRLPSHR